MGKENVVHIYYEVLFRHKKKETCNNMDGPWKHNGELNKSEKEKWHLVLLIYGIFSKKEFIDLESRSVVARS